MLTYCLNRGNVRFCQFANQRRRTASGHDPHSICALGSHSGQRRWWWDTRHV